MRRFFTALLLVPALAIAAACGDDDNNNSDRFFAGPSVLGTTGVTISGGSQPLSVGQSITLRATAAASDGSTRDVTSQAFWRSTNTFVCSASEGGVIVAANVGICDVSVAYDAQTATVNITVVGPGANGGGSFASIHVRAPRTLAAGTGDRFIVIGTRGDGSQSDITASATFSSSNPGVANVDRDGRVGATSPGSTTITVGAGGQQTSFPLTVTPASTGGGNGSGSGTGGGGTGTGGAGGGSGTSAPYIEITGGLSLAPGGSTQLRAVLHNADGSTQDVTSAAVWGSDNPLLSVSSGGLLSVVNTLPALLLDPDALITANYGGVSGSTNARVILQ